MPTLFEPKSPTTLAEWTETLCLHDLPIFSTTAQNLYSNLEDDDKGVAELAEIILQDPNLTAKLLKMSNSPFYNHSNQNLTTVTRAIIILGCNVIRELTVACSLFEAVLSPDNKQQAAQVIGESILAAVHAKEIAASARIASPESVFVATLLNNIGAIAFWCFGDKHCDKMCELMKDGQLATEDIEQKVLGFKLETLTLKLCKSWKLGGLIDEAITQTETHSKEVATVHLGKAVTAAMAHGWDSPEMLKCVKKIEKLTGQSSTSVLAQLKQNTAKAIKIARQFDAIDASAYIKLTETRAKTLAQSSTLQQQAGLKQLQFKLLQDIGFMLGGRFDINALFEKILSGIHDGIGMDRTLFCLLSADKTLLKERFALGWHSEPNSPKLQLLLNQSPSNLFNEGLASPQGLWANPASHKALYSMHVINTIGKAECFLLPIYTDNKPVGLIYCDRAHSSTAFTEDDFNTAKHFTQHAVIGLSIYRMNNKVQN